jgi:hypothetical protein
LREETWTAQENGTQAVSAAQGFPTSTSHQFPPCTVLDTIQHFDLAR